MARYVPPESKMTPGPVIKVNKKNFPEKSTDPILIIPGVDEGLYRVSSTH